MVPGVSIVVLQYTKYCDIAILVHVYALENYKIIARRRRLLLAADARGSVGILAFPIAILVLAAA